MRAVHLDGAHADAEGAAHLLVRRTARNMLEHSCSRAGQQFMAGKFAGSILDRLAFRAATANVSSTRLITALISNGFSMKSERRA